MRTIVIFNPKAGGADELPPIHEALAALPDAVLVETEEASHAEELARDAARRGVELVVAAGGDGTLNEVLNGLAGALDEVRLGVLPVGTGNDFIRSIGVPDDFAAAVEVLARGATRRLDVARATAGGGGRLFLNVSAGGFAHQVGEALDAETKSRWGALAYARSAAGALPDLEAYPTVITVDGGETLELRLYLAVVANARYVASGIPVAPRARLDDGLLDLVVFPEMSLAELAMVVPRTLLGRHLDDERVIFRRAPRFVIRAEPPLAFNTDGELLAAATTTFEVLPGAVEVVVGRLAQEDDEAPAGAAAAAAPA